MREVFFFSSRRRHTRLTCDWSSDVCSSDLCRSSQQGQREIDLNLHVGARLPAYCTSMGKVLLAYLPAEVRRRRLEEIEFKIGRASCRERVQSSVGAVRSKQQTKQVRPGLSA